jgi:hypothetical protein
MRGLCAAIFGCLAIALIASTGCKKSACTTSSDCSSGKGCYFPVGDCAAEGVCIDPTTSTTCGVITFVCGCDGKSLAVSCNDPDGYASAPTVSGQFLDVGTAGVSCNTNGSSDAAIDQ